MLLPLLLLAGLGGLLFYESKKKAAARAPALPPAGCTPATALVPGRLYLFAHLQQPGTMPLEIGDARLQTLAQGFVHTGRWQNVVAWVRGDPRAPAFAWLADAPGDAALVRGIYTGPPAAIPASMSYTTDCGPAAAAAPRTQAGILPLRPPSGPAVNAGYLYEDHLAGGMPRMPPMTGGAPNFSMTGTGTGAVSPPPTALSPEQLPALVMRICAVVLAQAMEMERQGQAGPGLQAGPVPGSHALPPSDAPLPAPAPEPAPAPAAAPVAASASAMTGGGGGLPLARGRMYFVAWPSGGGPLRRDLWEMARVTDSAMSPNHFAADPNKEPIPLKAVPQSAPQAWLSSYGRGKAIAVLTWTGPEGGSDALVEVLGEYAPRRPGEQAAA